MEKKKKIQKKIKIKENKKLILKLRKKWRSNIHFKGFEKIFWCKYTLVFYDKLIYNKKIINKDSNLKINYKI